MGRTRKEGLSPQVFSTCDIVSESIGSGVSQAKVASYWKDGGISEGLVPSRKSKCFCAVTA